MRKAKYNFIIASILAIALMLGITPLKATAANVNLHMVLGIGRSSALIDNGTSVKIDRIEKDEDPRSYLIVPLIDSGSTYVPFRYIMETAGFAIDYDRESGTIGITQRGGGNFPFWIETPLRGARKVAAGRIDYKSNIFTITTFNETETERIQIAPSKTFFGRTYIPIRELERFGFIIHWDGIYNTVHIVSDSSNTFQTTFEDYYKETNIAFRGLKASSYINGMNKSEAYYDAYERFISYGTEYGNYSNNSLAVKTPDGLFVSTVGEGRKGEYAAVTAGSRQLTYSTASGRNAIYYISNYDKKLYRAVVVGKERTETPTKVALPPVLANKKLSQLIINHDRMFFVAYDNVQSGGHIYMARVGDEADSAVKLTKDRAWNIALTADYMLYYTNFDRNCSLYTINLKDVNNLAQLYYDRSIGLDGVLRQKVGIQSFAISRTSSDTYYYSDTSTGAIMEATIASTGGVATYPLKKPSTSAALMNFLNIYEASDGRILYYIEYANGRLSSFTSCRIMSYNLISGEEKEVYMTNNMIMQLTIVGKSIFFTNGDYTKLYKFDITETGYIFTEF